MVGTQQSPQGYLQGGRKLFPGCPAWVRSSRDRFEEELQPVAFSEVKLSYPFGGQWEGSTEPATHALIRGFGSLFPPAVFSAA